MTKRELIDAIVDINPTAMPEFLARFSDLALREYYEHLCAARQPRSAGHGECYEQYFDEPAATPSPQSHCIAVAQVADDLDETDEELTDLLAERAHRALNHLLDDDADPAATLVHAEDFDDPAPVTKRAVNTSDPYPLELDDLSHDDPMADIGLSPRHAEPEPEPVAAATGYKQTVNRLDELKQERSLF